MKLELKHLAPYLPYKLKVVEWYLGKQIHDEFIVDCVNWDGKNIGGSDASLDSFELERMFNLRDIKPILRPLSDITEAEARSFLKLAHGGHINFTEINIDTINKDDLYLSSELSDGTIVCLRANHTLDGLCISTYSIATNDNTTTYPTPLFIYNLFFKHHFDVFNLIDNNLAIDKTKI